MSSLLGPDAAPCFAPDGDGSGELREKGSRFLALIVAASSEAEATAALEGVRQEHRDATHHCWAWRLGRPARERCADDGEPAGTAGMPILQVLRGAGLSDALLVVVRWYGGTKLGKGGLARAYAGAARLAVDSAGRLERIERTTVAVSMPYEQVGAVKRLLDAPGRRLLAEEYGEAVRMTLSVAAPDLAGLEAAVADLGPPVVLRPVDIEGG